MNRYFKEIMTQWQSASVFQEESISEESRELASLVLVTGFNSCTDSGAVTFPTLTRWNTKPYKNVDCVAMLGKAEVDKHRADNPFKCESTHSPVTVGSFLYHTDRKENVGVSENLSSRSRYCVRSWFAILAKDVPGYVHKDPINELDIYIYGRFKLFIHLDMVQWEKVYYLAECELYRAVRHIPVTNSYVIHLEKSLVPFKYVALKDVVGPIVLGHQLNWRPAVPEGERAPRHNQAITPVRTGYLTILCILER